MKKLIGYSLLFISVPLIIADVLLPLTVFAFTELGFLGGLFNFTLLPVVFFLFPMLRLFVTGDWFEIIYSVVLVLLIIVAFKLLNEKPKRIEKPKSLSLDTGNLPTVNGFDLIKALFSVPFSYYLIVFSTGLTTAIGGLLIFLIYYAESSLINRVHFGILIMLGLGVVISILMGLYSMISGFRSKRIFEIAFELSDRSSPIFNLTKEVSDKLKTSMPDHILISFSPEFHVHQAKATLFDGTKIKGRTLTFGYPFIKYLNPQEAKAVIAHELAHFTGRDTLLSLYAFPTYKSFQVLISNLASLFHQDEQNNKESSVPWMALPNFLSLLLLTKFYERFSKLIAKIDRVREARADIIGAISFGTNAFTEGLTTVVKIGPLFSKTSERDYWESITKHGKVFANYYSFFDERYLSDDEVKKSLNQLVESDSITNEFDAHFSLKERLDYLPDNNDLEYKKESILDKGTEKQYEEKLSEMYGTFIGILSERFTRAPEKQAVVKAEEKNLS